MIPTIAHCYETIIALHVDFCSANTHWVENFLALFAPVRRFEMSRITFFCTHWSIFILWTLYVVHLYNLNSVYDSVV